MSTNVVIVQDTDVTITGVYVNSSLGSSQEAYCKMQYRVQSSVTEERLVVPGQEQPPKSYTPLSALSCMLPPGSSDSVLGRYCLRFSAKMVNWTFFFLVPLRRCRSHSTRSTGHPQSANVIHIFVYCPSTATSSTTSADTFRTISTAYASSVAHATSATAYTPCQHPTAAAAANRNASADSATALRVAVPLRTDLHATTTSATANDGPEFECVLCNRFAAERSQP